MNGRSLMLAGLLVESKLNKSLPKDFDVHTLDDPAVVELFRAVKENDIATVSRIVSQNSFLLGEQNESLDTPLHAAARLQNK